jgi:hypothetical protein
MFPPTQTGISVNYLAANLQRVGAYTLTIP